MNGNSTGRRLSCLVLLLGVAALALRKGLYLLAVDGKGLLVRSHPLEVALAALTAGALTFLLLAVRKVGGSERYGDHHTADLPAALGCVAAGAGILVTVLTATPVMGGYLHTLWRVLGLASPVCMLLAAFARVRGKTPFFGFHVVVCLYFVMHIVTRYQLWSGDPQLQNYIFTLLGTMALMFFAFYTATLEAGYGNSRMNLGMGLAALYLCTAELARSSCPVLYLGSILWVLTELCSMKSLSAVENQ